MIIIVRAILAFGLWFVWLDAFSLRLDLYESGIVLEWVILPSFNFGFTSDGTNAEGRRRVMGLEAWVARGTVEAKGRYRCICELIFGWFPCYYCVAWLISISWITSDLFEVCGSLSLRIRSGDAGGVQFVLILTYGLRSRDIGTWNDGAYWSKVLNEGELTSNWLDPDGRSWITCAMGASYRELVD